MDLRCMIQVFQARLRAHGSSPDIGLHLELAKPSTNTFRLVFGPNFPGALVHSPSKK